MQSLGVIAFHVVAFFIHLWYLRRTFQDTWFALPGTANVELGGENDALPRWNVEKVTGTADRARKGDFPKTEGSVRITLLQEGPTEVSPQISETSSMPTTPMPWHLKGCTVFTDSNGQTRWS